MSNVVSMNCTCEYLVKRAARHRRAGRYDEAMALLWKAWNLFGTDADAQLEMARTYDEIGCEEEAARAYLRIVRLGEKYRAQALFHLALFSAQRGDVSRAVSYFERFSQCGPDNEISEEMAEILKRQLISENKNHGFRSKRARARYLERYSASCLQAGRVIAAQRAIEHGLKLYPRAQGYVMLACCQMIRGNHEDAALAAQKAHVLSPASVQNLSVLCEAYAASGNRDRAKRALALAELRAQEVDDLLCVAVESAKAGDDALTLRMTQKILKRQPFHTRAMMICACALINTKQEKQAERLLGRLCGLLPEDMVCESYYKRLRDGGSFSERLSLGVDVTRDDGIQYTSELIAALCNDLETIAQDKTHCTRLIRLCDWALHSPMAGGTAKTAALVLLASIPTERAKDVLLDTLMDQMLADSFKLNALQLLTAKYGFEPYDADIGCKLVRLAAGGIVNQPVRTSEANSALVQRVADSLSARHPDAPQMLLSMFLTYLDAYGRPARNHENACSAALECWYLSSKGLALDMASVCRRYGVSVRLMRMYLRRFESCMQKNKQPQQGESI